MNLVEREGGLAETLRLQAEQVKSSLHVATPGIIERFDPERRTADIQPVIREQWMVEGEIEHHPLPLLLDVPVFFPAAGGYQITLPVQAGDECLVVFADRCIDAWFQSGGIQNQMEIREHDLSDGFAFVGFSSLPRATAIPSPEGLTLAHQSGSAGITITEDEVRLWGNVRVNDMTIP